MFPKFWKDDKFWTIIITAILAILNDVFGFNVPTEVVWSVVALVFSWVFGKSIAEATIKAAVIRKEGYPAALKRFEK